MTNDTSVSPSAEVTEAGVDVSSYSSTADIKRRMMYLRERLKDLRVERERLIAERDGLKAELEHRASQAVPARA